MSERVNNKQFRRTILNKFKKTICIGMVIIMCIGFYTGCRNKNDIWYNVIMESKFINSTDQTIFQILRTSAELTAICEERYLITLNSDGTEVNYYYLRELADECDDVYFEEKALILYSFFESDTNAKTEISSIEKLDNTIKININKIVQENDYIPTVNLFVLIIEINQLDAVEITNIEKNIKIKEKN